MPKSLIRILSLLILTLLILQTTSLYFMFMKGLAPELFGLIFAATPFTVVVGLIIGFIGLLVEDRDKKWLPLLILIIGTLHTVLNSIVFLGFYYGLIIGAIIFLLVYLIFDNDFSRTKIIKKGVTSLLVLSLLFGVYFICIKQKPFSPERWENDPHHRADIVEDFLETRKLIGMDKKEVTEILGPPENHYFKEPDNIVYYLGNKRFGIMVIDSEWLVIRFDSKNKASYYEIKTD